MTGKTDKVSIGFHIYLSKTISLSDGIKKFPLLNFTSNKSFDLIPIITPTSSRDTRSGGLNIEIGSAVFKYGKGPCKDTFSPTENFIITK